MSEDDWKDMNVEMPDDFELVFVLLESKKVYPGWWTGVVWDGRQHVLNKKVIGWRHMFKGRGTRSYR